jgi:hypothetical protein
MPVEIVPETPLEVVPEVDTRDKVSFMGAEFAIADKIGLMPVMKLAKAAKSGLDSADMEGLAAMHDMLEQCIADDDWPRFEDHATKTHADHEELLQVVKDVTVILTGRPTSRPSDSSDGPKQTSPTSVEDSSSLEVVRRLKSQGRQDLGMAVLRQVETG